MTKFLQTLMDSLALGSLYALIALGYTMVYGVLGFINFAHGAVFMVGAWLSYTVARAAGWRSLDHTAPFYAFAIVLLTTMAACVALGLTIERLAYRPLRSAPRLNVLITAIGVSLLLENLGQLPFVFGTQPQGMPMLVPNYIVAHVCGVNIRLVDIVGIVLTVVLMIGLERMIYTSKIGLAMRAVSYDVKLAALMGVPVDRIISLTFAIGSALAAAAGFLYAVKYTTIQQPSYQLWVLLGLKAFIAAVVGGIGNVRGAILGGLLIGAFEKFGEAYVSSSLRDVFVFSILILVLLIRPSGIIGKPRLEKV